MKTTNRLSVPISLGVDQRIPPERYSAELVENFTYEKRTRGWDSRIGYETYLPVSGATMPLRDDLPKRVDSVYFWSKEQGRLQYLFAEGVSAAGLGRLLLIRPKTKDVYELDVKRKVAGPNDYNTQYIPFGDYLVILNGTDKPIKVSMWPFDFYLSAGPSPVYPLGWQGTPTVPDAWGVSTDPDKSAPAAEVAMYIGATSNEGGLGSADGANFDGKYSWKVSFVNQSGSESPLSAATPIISWDDAATRQVCMVEIPRGPKGTVARRLYRTKDMSTGFLSEYFYVGQVDNNIDPIIYDSISDTALITQAPSVTASVSMPAPKARFGAAFNNCLFLEAGAHVGTRVHFSTPGTIDQFGLLDFLDVGARDSGSITGMHSYYDSLILFREKGIDVIRGTYPNFTVSGLAGGVGCVGPDSIVEIPGQGLLFMSQDGVYVLQGGLEGGSAIQVLPVTDGLFDTLRTVNRGALSRSMARYSNKWREAHFYIPTEGEDRPNIGIVYHLDKRSWSVRRGFPVGCLTTTWDGDFVFGHSYGTLNQPLAEAGLFVISRTRHAGYNTQADSEDNITAALPVTSVYRSVAHDFEAPEVKKFVKYVYLYALTTGGDNSISLEYRLDDDYVGTVTESRQMQRPDHPDQAVFDTAIYNTDVWEKGLVTEIRFPVPEKACDRFQFEVSTTNDMVLVGYSIDYSMTGTKVITGQSTSSTRSRA